MDLEDTGTRTRFLVRDHDGKFPALFDAVLADAGIQIVLSGVRIPQMNSIMGRWIQNCRHELLNRTLIRTSGICSTLCGSTNSSTTRTDPTRASPTHDHYTRCHHRSPTKPGSPTSTSADGNGWAASSTSTTTRPDQHGRHFRLTQRRSARSRSRDEAVGAVGGRSDGCACLRSGERMVRTSGTSCAHAHQVFHEICEGVGVVCDLWYRRRGGSSELDPTNVGGIRNHRLVPCLRGG